MWILSFKERHGSIIVWMLCTRFLYRGALCIFQIRCLCGEELRVAAVWMLADGEPEMCVLCFSFCFIYRLPKRCLHAFNVQKHFMILHFYKCSVWVSVALKTAFQNSSSTLIGQLWWQKQGNVGDIAKLCGLLDKAVTWSHDRTTTCCFYPWACWHHSRANVGLDGVICHLFCCWQRKQEEVDENRFVWNVSLLKAQLAC